MVELFARMQRATDPSSIEQLQQQVRVLLGLIQQQ